MMLEDRRLLSTIVVNNPTDTPVVGQIDLRQAISQANMNGGNETITFDSKVFKTPQTINLNGTQLDLSDSTGTETIVGPKAGVTVNAGGNSRVFEVNSQVAEQSALVSAEVEMIVLSPFAACSSIASSCTGTCWDIREGKASKSSPLDNHDSFPVSRRRGR